jgi:hypothetical protein
MLSDYPGEMLAGAVSERARGSADHEARVAAARRDRDQARAARRWLAWLRLAFRASREKREATRKRLFTGLPTGREEAIRAGGSAERRVADELGLTLNDDWVLFRGYRNRRGEIDGLLVGPRGLFAYEVKYHNGTVYVRGDDWSTEKFDKYGNLVETRGPMKTDARGRSPSRQLNESAAMLQGWLRRRGQQAVLTPVVLLTHDRSRVGSIQNPTVEVATSVQGLLGLVGRSRSTLTIGQRTEIERIIARDHQHHEQQRSATRDR